MTNFEDHSDTFDKIDLHLLTLLQKDGRATFVKLASKLGVASHVTVKNRFQALKSQNYLEVKALTNVQKLGYNIVIILISSGSMNNQARIIEDLKDCPRIIYFGSTIGKYDIFIMAYAEDYITLESFLGSFLNCKGKRHEIQEKEILFIGKDLFPPFFPVQFSFFPEETDTLSRIEEYSTNCNDCRSHQTTSCLVCPNSDQLSNVLPSEILDKVGLHLLTLLQKNGRARFVNLASELGFASHVTVKNRFQAIKRQNCFKIRALTNVQKIGLETAIISISSASMNDQSRIIENLKDCPRILHIGSTIGKYDIFIIVIAENRTILESFLGCFLTCKGKKYEIQKKEILLIGKDLFPAFFPIQLATAPEKMNIISRTLKCGNTCDSCVRYQNNLCIGCPDSDQFLGILRPETKE